MLTFIRVYIINSYLLILIPIFFTSKFFNPIFKVENFDRIFNLIIRFLLNISDTEFQTLFDAFLMSIMLLKRLQFQSLRDELGPGNH